MTNNPFKKLWFWLLILSIILFISAIILFESLGSSTTSKSTPYWIWILFGLAFVAWVIAIILYAVDIKKINKQREIDIACGRYIPPQPKKVECPKPCVDPQPPCQTVPAPTTVTAFYQQEISPPSSVVSPVVSPVVAPVPAQIATPSVAPIAAPVVAQVSAPVAQVSASDITSSYKTASQMSEGYLKPLSNLSR